MTKTLRVIGTLLTAAVLVLCYTACGDDDDDDKGNGGNSTTTNKGNGNGIEGRYYWSGQTLTYFGDDYDETIPYDRYKEGDESSDYDVTITHLSGNKYSIELRRQTVQIEISEFRKGKKIMFKDENNGYAYFIVTGPYTFAIKNPIACGAYGYFSESDCIANHEYSGPINYYTKRGH